VFERIKPLFALMGGTITRVGDSGAGQITKACNQLALLVAAQLVLGAGTALGTQPLLTTTLHNAVAALLAVALAAVAGSATAASAAPRRSAG
jgi:3-hydroxyisobutyrate dehydrogenase-like beta-hydroxyacid dehydrogenase